MYLHANAKLGLAARFALVQAVEGGCSIRRRGGAVQRLAGDGASLVASLAARPVRRPGGRFRACSIVPVVRIARRVSSRRSSRRRSAPAAVETGWGPRLVAGATGFAHSTVWKVLKRAGISRPPRAREGVGQPVRVALPRRPAAHGHKPLRALPAARPPRHRRPLQHAVTGCAARQGSATTTRTRSSTTTPGSPTSSSTTTRKRRP